MKIWDNIEQCLEYLKVRALESFPLTTKGSATPHTVDLNRPVALLMGPETRGLPEHVRLMFPQKTGFVYQWQKTHAV
jgi:tRNA (cytidine/uridine-2'-O-)-methyltransferase